VRPGHGHTGGARASIHPLRIVLAALIAVVALWDWIDVRSAH
jgi:hypothetical protein